MLFLPIICNRFEEILICFSFSVCDGATAITARDKESRKRLNAVWKTFAASEFIFTLTYSMNEVKFVHHIATTNTGKPKLLSVSKIDFGTLQAGMNNHYSGSINFLESWNVLILIDTTLGRYFTLKNPKSVPIFVHLILDKTTLAGANENQNALVDTFFITPEFSNCMSFF